MTPIDSLLFDVLTDPDTRHRGQGVYERRGVLYEFTLEECRLAILYFGECLKRWECRP